MAVKKTVFLALPWWLVGLGVPYSSGNNFFFFSPVVKLLIHV